MKKISTKIILLSVVNSLIVAMINVGASLFMNSSGAGAPAAGSAATGATGAASAGVATSSAVSTASAPAMQGGGLITVPTPVFIGLGISMVLGVILAYILGKLITRPILKVIELTEKTSNFDLAEDQSFEKVLQNKDETGVMARALWNTRKALRDMAGKLQSISSTVESHSDRLTRTTDENVKTITQVVNTINEISEGNNNQAQTISNINATLSDVVGLMDEITEEARKGSENAVRSLDSIQEGQEAVDVQAKKMDENIVVSGEANKSIYELSKMIEQVESITGVITSISDQTNMLALNAAIEAARAGETGKGFSVVAEEIRNLAEKSSGAINEITRIINDTKEKTSLSVSSIDKAGLLVGEQKEAMKITQAAFERMKTSYDRIVESFQQTASAMNTINGKSKNIFDQTQDMAAIAEESAASAQEISAAGQEQLAASEMIAQSSRELNSLTLELNAEIKIFKI